MIEGSEAPLNYLLLNPTNRGPTSNSHSQTFPQVSS